MSLYELYRHDVQVYTDYSTTDTRQIPGASISVYVYKEGAYANGTIAVGAGSSGAITVHDPGAIQAGDTIQIGTDSTATRVVDTVDATTINVLTGAAALSGNDGDRIVATDTTPVLYTDDQGVETTASPLTTDSTGAAYFYTKEPVVDLVLDDGTTKTLLADRSGEGGRTSYTPFTFGALVNGTDDDATAMANLETYVEAKGGGVIELPPGTTLLSSKWTISASNVTIRGAGRGVTTLKIAHAGLGIHITGTDVTLQDLTIERTTTPDSDPNTLAGEDSVAYGNYAMLKLAGTRTTLRDIYFTLSSTPATVYGITCNKDTDTRASNLWFVNSGTSAWTSFISLKDSTRPHFTSVVARYASNITAGINVGAGCISARFDKCDVSPTTITAAGGVAFRIAKDTASSAAVDTIVTTSRFCGGTTTGTDAAVQVSTLTGTKAASGAEFIGVQCVDSNIGYDLKNGQGVKIVGGMTLGINTHAISIGGGGYYQISEHLSSDINVTGGAGTSSHVTIANAVNDVYINGLTVGKFIRATGQQAQDAVEIGTSTTTNARIQIMGIRGVVGDLGTWITNRSTSQEIDIGHCIFYSAGSSISYPHTSLPGAEGINGYAGTRTVTDSTDVTPSVLNVSVLMANLDGASTWSALDNGRDGQIVTIVDISASNHVTIADAGSFALTAGPYTSTEDDTITLVYSQATAQWHEIARAAN